MRFLDEHGRVVARRWMRVLCWFIDHDEPLQVGRWLWCRRCGLKLYRADGQ